MIKSQGYPRMDHTQTVRTLNKPLKPLGLLGPLDLDQPKSNYFQNKQFKQ